MPTDAEELLAVSLVLSGSAVLQEPFLGDPVLNAVVSSSVHCLCGCELAHNKCVVTVAAMYGVVCSVKLQYHTPASQTGSTHSCHDMHDILHSILFGMVPNTDSITQFSAIICVRNTNRCLLVCLPGNRVCRL